MQGLALSLHRGRKVERSFQVTWKFLGWIWLIRLISSLIYQSWEFQQPHTRIRKISAISVSPACTKTSLSKDRKLFFWPGLEKGWIIRNVTLLKWGLWGRKREHVTEATCDTVNLLGTNTSRLLGLQVVSVLDPGQKPLHKKKLSFCSHSPIFLPVLFEGVSIMGTVLTDPTHQTSFTTPHFIPSWISSD